MFVLKKVDESVYEKKKSYMGSICNFIFSQKASFEKHIELVNESKKNIEVLNL